MTDLDVYQPAGGIGQYQAGIVMTPEDAKALDAQVRACTKAVLREGTDYGVIPGTSGEQTLWRPGAQKLLQWFGLGYACDRVEVERDDDGRKHGITYKCTVARRLPDGSLDIKATCEGTADYDESKFYQSAEQVKARLRDQEHRWAAKDHRVPNADRWNNAKEYRADWNALMKRAQKRAIVGAVVDATAAGGIFTDREEDDSSPVPQDDSPGFYEQAIGKALTFTDVKAARGMYTGAAQAHRDGLITRRQQDHIQNTLQQREKLLKKATPVDVEDLARQAGDGTAQREAAAGDETRSRPRSAGDPAPAQDGQTGDRTARDPDPRAAGAASSRGAQPLPPLPGGDESTDVGASGPYSNEQAGSVEASAPGSDRHRKLVGVVRAHFKRLGYTDGDDTQRLEHTATLAGTSELGSTNDLDEDELSVVADTLARCKNVEALQSLLNAGEVDG
jgi:hypothetical protein